MKNLILFLFTILLVTACKTQRPMIAEVPVQYKERIVERLVPVQLPADSSAMFALFECDSDKQVILKQLLEEKGKAQSSVSFQEGKLTYKSTTKPDTVYLPAKDSIIYQEVPLRIEVPVKVNELTKRQIFEMYVGRITILVLLAFVLIKARKWLLKLI